MTNDEKKSPSLVAARSQATVKIYAMGTGMMRVAGEYEDCIEVKARSADGACDIEVHFPIRHAASLHIGTQLRVTVEGIA